MRETVIALICYLMSHKELRYSTCSVYQNAPTMNVELEAFLPYFCVIEPLLCYPEPFHLSVASKCRT